MVANNLVEELISAVKPDEEKRNTTYSAIVTRVDKDGTAWVCIAGSEKETPVSSSAAGIKRGDAVNVEWRNNKIYIAGNRSDPATGDAAALAARALAIIAESRAAGAQEVAVSAEASAAESSLAVNDMQDRMDSGEFKGEDATVLRIDSSRGTVFKNDSIATVLTVAIYTGGNRITDITELHRIYGSSAHLQWYWQRIGDETYGIIVDSDHKLSNDGFTLTLTPEEVDTKVTFMCELITD